MPAPDQLETTAQGQLEQGLADKPLTDDGLATLKMLLLGMREADADQYPPPNESPHVARLYSIVRLLWGSDGERALRGDKLDKGDELDQANDLLAKDAGGEATAVSPGFAGMSAEPRTLADCFRSGRMKARDFVALSAESPLGQAAAVRMTASIPAGKYDDHQRAAQRRIDDEVDAQLKRSGRLR